MRRRDDRMERPARVRIRRRKPWVLCRRRLFGWNVRLLTDSLHSRGWAERSDHRVTMWATLVDQHRAPTTLWTVVDMRPRSTPVSTCQRYALAVHRVNSERAPRMATVATC